MPVRVPCAAPLNWRLFINAQLTFCVICWFRWLRFAPMFMIGV